MTAITLDLANRIIDAVLRRAAEIDCRPISVIVVEPGCKVKAFQKEDGSSMVRFEMAYGKAYAALALGRSSRLVLAKSREKPIFMENLEKLATGPMFLEGGGQLVRDAGSGEVVGAVGVTGDVNEMDDISAVAGIHAAGFKSDYDFTDPADMHAMNIKDDVLPTPPKA